MPNASTQLFILTSLGFPFKNIRLETWAAHHKVTGSFIKICMHKSRLRALHKNFMQSSFVRSTKARAFR